MAMLGRHIMDLRVRIELRNIRSACDRVRHYLLLNAGADGTTVTLGRTLREGAGNPGLTHAGSIRRTTPAMVAGITKRLWEMSDVVDVLEAWAAGSVRT
jgi:hypothetical protein